MRADRWMTTCIELCQIVQAQQTRKGGGWLHAQVDAAYKADLASLSLFADDGDGGKSASRTSTAKFTHRLQLPTRIPPSTPYKYEAVGLMNLLCGYIYLSKPYICQLLRQVVMSTDGLSGHRRDSYQGEWTCHTSYLM